MIVLHIILQILKWLGIVLGALLALILLLILLILFVPIRYSMDGHKYETADATVKITWLLKIISFTAEWHGGTDFPMRLKVFGFKVWESETNSSEGEGPDADLSDEEYDEKLNEELEKNFSESTGGQNTETTEITEASKNDGIDCTADNPENTVLQTEHTAVDTPSVTECEVIDLDAEEQKPTKTKAELKAEKRIKKQQKAAEKKKRAEEKAANGENVPKKSFDEKLDAVYDKIVNVIETPFRFFEKLENKKDVVTDFIDDRQNRAGIELCKKTLVKLLKAIAPRKGRGKIEFGTGDPSSTGYALAGLSILYAGLRGKFIVTPDFEEKKFNGEGFIKGRIFLITLLVLFCRLWFNKNFKALKESASGLKERIKNA